MNLNFKEIKDLIRFYFSNENLSKDNLLLDIITKNEGWVNLKQLFEFKDFKNVLGNVQLNNDEIQEIFKLISEDKGAPQYIELELSDDFTKVSRVIPYVPSTFIDKNKVKNEKTCYIEPFDEHTTNDTIKSLFTEFADQMVNISIPRFSNFQSKGYVFIEFNEHEQMLQFINTINSNPQLYSNRMAITRNEWEQYKNSYSYLNQKNLNRIIKITGIPKEMKYKELYGYFDKIPYFRVIYLDYKNGKSDAILKFRNDNDLQMAIHAIYSEQVKLADNSILRISPMSRDELSRFRNTQNNYKSKKYFSNSGNSKPNQTTTTTTTTTTTSTTSTTI
ncbi:hypothetical protein DLAC_00610 [Tieghemostelium lacteum]|uniref:Uncharacterized protein n=1 Tax=Tieghemostelium lacteum TaxID=361077 RepID=A0A152AAF4_TIELA|nr:hypothetical protein DLAC_00610 [Tieghemostelium lacteum]|eukprot:KYR03115.1 hypothetical protein DLAC_00610 [Tieghemostelium lacteum]